MSADLTSHVEILTADGLELTGAFYAGGSRSDVGLLLVHGFGGTYDGPPLISLAEGLAERGFSTLALNMRDAGCCTYTSLFEDSTMDIDAGVQFMRAAGATRVVVLGHSLGANHVTYYQAQIHNPAVTALIILAGVGNAFQVGAAFDEGAGRTALAEAMRRLATNDRVDELIEVPVGSLGTFYYTPGSLVSNGGPDTNSDMFKWLPEIEVPLLIVHATNDGFSAFQQPALARELAIRSPRADLVYVEGADHAFTGHEGEVTDLLDAWLSQVVSAN